MRLFVGRSHRPRCRTVILGGSDTLRCFSRLHGVLLLLLLLGPVHRVFPALRHAIDRKLARPLLAAPSTQHPEHVLTSGKLDPMHGAQAPGPISHPRAGTTSSVPKTVTSGPAVPGVPLPSPTHPPAPRRAPEAASLFPLMCARPGCTVVARAEPFTRRTRVFGWNAFEGWERTAAPAPRPRVTTSGEDVGAPAAPSPRAWTSPVSPSRTSSDCGQGTCRSPADVTVTADATSGPPEACAAGCHGLGLFRLSFATGCDGAACGVRRPHARDCWR